MDELELRLQGALRDVATLPLDDIEATDTVHALRDRRRSLAPAMAAAAVLALVGAGVGVRLFPFGESSSADGVVAEPGGRDPKTSVEPSSDDARLAAVERLSGFSLMPGFGSVDVDDDDSSRVILRWGGDVPVAVADAVGEISASGVPAEIVAARYTLAELQAAGHRLFDVERRLIDDAIVSGSRPSDDFSGIVVEVKQPWDGDPGTLRGVAGVPLEIVLVNYSRVPAANTE